jgi:hypothetical protein
MRTSQTPGGKLLSAIVLKQMKSAAKRQNHHHRFIRDEGRKQECSTDTNQRLGGRAIDKDG